MLSPKMVVFDIDGVVFDSLKDVHRAISAVCVHCQIEPPELKNLCACFSAPYEESYANLGVRLPASELWRIHNSAMGKYDPPVMPGFAETAKTLRSKGLVICAVSGNLSIRILPHLQKHGLLSIFQDVVCDKTDKRSTLRHLTESWEIFPQEALMVGDMTSDIGEAKEMGLRPIGFDAGYGGRNALVWAGAERVVKSHQELLGLVA